MGVFFRSAGFRSDNGVALIAAELRRPIPRLSAGLTT
jgi:hypothetical protein